MPCYDLICKKCGEESEHLLGMQDSFVHVKCPACAAKMTRGDNMKWAGLKISIQGDTVAGGCSYDYYDEHLGVQVRSKQHRAEEMKKQGLTDYAPDPEFKGHRDEVRHIRKHSRPGDVEAASAIHKEQQTAVTKRQERTIDRVFDNAPLPTLPEM